MKSLYKIFTSFQRREALIKSHNYLTPPSALPASWSRFRGLFDLDSKYKANRAARLHFICNLFFWLHSSYLNQELNGTKKTKPYFCKMLDRAQIPRK